MAFVFFFSKIGVHLLATLAFLSLGILFTVQGNTLLFVAPGIIKLTYLTLFLCVAERKSTVVNLYGKNNDSIKVKNIKEKLRKIR